MRRLFLCMCFTFVIHPMEQFLLPAVSASMAGLVAYSAGRQRHLSETEQHSQAYAKLSTELEQLKDNLSKSGLLIRGIHQTVLCNPLNTLLNRSIEVGDENGMSSVLLHMRETFNINGLDENGSTALHIAARKKNEYCMKYLCALGAAPNTPDIFGMTPIHYAAQADDPEIIATLIHLGADLNVKTGNGYTPLMVALRADKKNATAFLLALKNIRAEIDRAPSPDHLVNLKGSFRMALELQRELTTNESPNSSHDSLALIFHAFLERNPECLICCDELPAQIYITKCCEKGLCPACVNDPRLDKKRCAHCREPLQPEPYMFYTQSSPTRPRSPQTNSSSAAASSSPSSS